MSAVNQDEEQLRLLAIFHYVIAGVSAFVSFIPLLYVAFGTFVLVAPQSFNSQNGEGPPPLLGWGLIGLGTLMCLCGLVFAFCIFFAGRSLSHRKRYWFPFVIACLECMFIPIGTILGVFTIIVLSRPAVKAMFGEAVAGG